MHDERYMHLGAEHDGSGSAGGQKGFVEREHIFLSSTFLGLVSIALLVGGWLVPSSIFLTHTTIKLHFPYKDRLSLFVYACMTN